ncbi:MAG: 6,7-dimethyl-8-ribityllumazine synthase [Rickettsiales bacterium]|nr:6,7-dimethyl-8-ribityllumazine synthase [Rickettsiales bacterium]
MSRILIAVATFYEDIAEELVLGAQSRLDVAKHQVDVVKVPGAFELPAAIRYAMYGADAYDGYIALGCVIRGETTHYDVVCNEAARGLQDIACDAPLGFGLLTVENKEQAMKRASVNQGNVGRKAADACLQMIALRERFTAE